MIYIFLFLMLINTSSQAQEWGAFTPSTNSATELKEIKIGRKDLIRNDLIISTLQIQQQTFKDYFQSQKSQNEICIKSIDRLEAENQTLKNELFKCQNTIQEQSKEKKIVSKTK